MMDIWRILPADPGETAVAVRQFAALYASEGLSLTAAEAQSIAAVHRDTMAENRLIEVGHGTIKRIIDTFALSPYVERQNFAQVLEGMCEAFAFLKREADGERSDTEILAAMRRLFDGPSGGSVELFLSREMEVLRHRLCANASLEIDGETDTEEDDDASDGES